MKRQLSMQTLVLTALIFSSFQMNGQNCNLSVSAGPDIVLCAPGQVNLNASVGGNFLSLGWTPATGIANPAAANTTATVSQTTVFSLAVRSISPVNLIVNGNFNQGDTGFDSDYVYGTGGGAGLLSNEGQYAIAGNAGTTHNQFANCNDHTGGGNMMVVNASGVTNNVWCQTVTVNANTDYDFSAWVTSVTSQNPARLQFSVNGSLLGNVFQAASNTCNWQQFNAQWASGASASAEICIVNVNQTPAGNDFAIDDISFREICLFSDEVTVTVADLDAGLNIPAGICGSSPAVNLQEWLGTGATPGGVWTLNGNPVSVFNPASVPVGNHVLRYTLTLGNCTVFEEATLAVAQPPNTGTASNQGAAACQGADQTASLFSLLQGADAGGTWVETSQVPSTNGAFNAAAGTFRTLGQLPGEYTFEYRLSGGGVCPDAATGVTFVIRPTPVANAGPDQILDCTVTSVELGGQGAQGIQYSWSLVGAGPITGANGPLLTIDEAGVYRLDAADASGNCTAFDEVIVESRITTIAGETSLKPITCNGANDGGIAVTAATGGDEPYLYALGDNPFQANPQFNGLAAGVYTVRIMDANGCETAIEVNLPAPQSLEIVLEAAITGDPPVISIGDSTEIRVLLNKPAEEVTGLVWTPALPDCANCLAVTVSPLETTVYQVRATDQNGCAASDEIIIQVRKTYHIFTPNAFSPNDDGNNDIFYIHSGNEITGVRSFRVMDRWGNLVFQDQNFLPNDPAHGWTGSFNNRPQNAAVYVFVAELETASGEIVVEKGEVVLVR